MNPAQRAIGLAVLAATAVTFPALLLAFVRRRHREPLRSRDPLIAAAAALHAMVWTAGSAAADVQQESTSCGLLVWLLAPALGGVISLYLWRALRLFYRYERAALVAARGSIAAVTSTASNSSALELERQLAAASVFMRPWFARGSPVVTLLAFCSVAAALTARDAEYMRSTGDACEDAILRGVHAARAGGCVAPRAPRGAHVRRRRRVCHQARAAAGGARRRRAYPRVGRHARRRRRRRLSPPLHHRLLLRLARRVHRVTARALLLAALRLCLSRRRRRGAQTQSLSRGCGALRGRGTSGGGGGGGGGGCGGGDASIARRRACVAARARCAADLCSAPILSRGPRLPRGGRRPSSRRLLLLLLLLLLSPTRLHRRFIARASRRPPARSWRWRLGAAPPAAAWRGRRRRRQPTPAARARGGAR